MSNRDLPSLNALRAFEAAARLGSMSLAARELFVTHGAVSRQIRTLEESLGRALFERQGRGVALTKAGQQLQEQCHGAFTQLREAWHQLCEEQAAPAFVLGCSGSVLARWVIPRLERLRHELPQLTVHLAAQDEPFPASATDVHASLVIAAPPWPSGWQVHELAAERIGPVLSPGYPSAPRLRDAPPSALADEPLLQTASRPQAWPNWAKAMGLPPTSLHPTQPLPHLYFLLEAAAAGLGVAIAPRALVADDIAKRRLIAPWEFRETTARWVLATRRPGDARVNVLAQWLAHQLAAE
ncbi:MAG: LysR family transcriptional regulator [Rhodanobacter sp.]|nr:MAG: LysR family transcriptional regulator [Rhodanobacter sp.]TAM12094.1 MAG: LysR family transcriptional regulator [Rhodanobacter sp.]TAM34565.1 MAG: LysR family transcriptional regulator [Rhodanobacter sp.]